MKHWTRIAIVLMFVPIVASAQFRDLDAAMSNLERGFGGGNVDAIVDLVRSGATTFDAAVAYVTDSGVDALLSNISRDRAVAGKVKALGG